MILDYLLRLRDGGTTALVTATELGTTTTLSRVTTTGQSVLDIRKTNQSRGLSVVVVSSTAGEYTNTGDTYVVTIVAAADGDEDFAGTLETVVTFPAFAETGATKAIAAQILIRRLLTQKRYIRSVLTASATLATGLTIGIFVTQAMEDVG